MTDETEVSTRDWLRGALRSKMMWANTVIFIIAGIELAGAHLTTLFGQKVAAAIMLIGALVNLYLRTKTTTPLPHR
jgi:hypothetical protein